MAGLQGDKVRLVTYGLVPFAILLGFVVGLVMLQPDLGAAILIILTAVAMFFIAGRRCRSCWSACLPARRCWRSSC